MSTHTGRASTDASPRLLLVAPVGAVEPAAARLREAGVEVATAASVGEAGDWLAAGDVDRVVCAAIDDASALSGRTDVSVVALGTAGSPEGIAAVEPGLDTPADELLAAIEQAVERHRRDDEEPVEPVEPLDPDYGTLVEEAGSGMFVLVEGRVRWVNERFADLLWYDPDELVGAKLTALVAEGDRVAAADAADPGAERQVAVAGRRKDGSTVPLFVRTSPVEHDGELAVAGTVLPREEGRVDDLVDGGVPLAGAR